MRLLLLLLVVPHDRERKGKKEAGWSLSEFVVSLGTATGARRRNEGMNVISPPLISDAARLAAASNNDYLSE